MAGAGWAAPIGPLLAQVATPAGATATPSSPLASAPIGAMPATAAPPSGGPAVAPAVDPNEPAHVYVYVGRTFWPGHSQLGIGKERWDVSIDDGQRIPLTPNRFLEFDTPAGPHRFTRYLHSLLGSYPASIDLTLAPGEEAYLGLNWYSDINPKTLVIGEHIAFDGGLLFGVVGGVATGLVVAAALAPGSKSPDQHKLGVWLVREPPPADEPTSSTAR